MCSIMQDHKPAHAVDHESDPAHTPGDGWVSEGGASHLGPATHTRLNPEDADEQSGTDAEDAEEAPGE